VVVLDGLHDFGAVLHAQVHEVRHDRHTRSRKNLDRDFERAAALTVLASSSAHDYPSPPPALMVARSWDLPLEGIPALPTRIMDPCLD
jgi:hypothetical protein